MQVMIRSELIAILARRFPQFTHEDTELAVKAILDGIAEALVQNRRVEVRGFGTFNLKRRPPRIGRNPKTGEKVEVPAKAVPHFKPGKELRERVENSKQPDQLLLQAIPSLCRCSSHTSGGLIPKSASVTFSGNVSSRIAATISGASVVRFTNRAT